MHAYFSITQPYWRQIFPYWEIFIPTLGINYSRPGNKTFPPWESLKTMWLTITASHIVMQIEQTV